MIKQSSLINGFILISGRINNLIAQKYFNIYYFIIYQEDSIHTSKILTYIMNSFHRLIININQMCVSFVNLISNLRIKNWKDKIDIYEYIVFISVNYRSSASKESFILFISEIIIFLIWFHHYIRVISNVKITYFEENYLLFYMDKKW